MIIVKLSFLSCIMMLNNLVFMTMILYLILETFFFHLFLRILYYDPKPCWNEYTISIVNTVFFMQMQRVEMEEMRQRDANRTALNALQGPKKKPKLDLSAMDDVSALLLYFLVFLLTRTDKKFIYFGEFLTDITSFTILHATIPCFFDNGTHLYVVVNQRMKLC